MANPEHVAIIQAEIDEWSHWRKENPEVRLDLEKADLKGVNLSCKILTDANFYGADLSDAYFGNAILRNAQFEEAILTRARFKGGTLEGANFSYAELTNAKFTGSYLSGASLRRAIVKDADLTYTDLRKADLRYADLQGSDLERANLKGAKLSFANFERTSLVEVKFGCRKRPYIGIRLTGCYGSERFRRYAQHQAFIQELGSSSFGNRWLVALWTVLADCGRTPWAWIGWSIVFVWFYAVVFWGMGNEAFNTQHLKFNLETMLYYSTVTFTTLGFGDIVPKTAEAARWVMAEVITGYVMLGGLISFIFSKLLPRG